MDSDSDFEVDLEYIDELLDRDLCDLYKRNCEPILSTSNINGLKMKIKEHCEAPEANIKILTAHVLKTKNKTVC